MAYIQVDNDVSKVVLNLRDSNSENFKEEMAYSKIPFAFVAYLQSFAAAQETEIDTILTALKGTSDETLLALAAEIEVYIAKADALDNGLDAVIGLLNTAGSSKAFQTTGLIQEG